jgi:hypothetical protein
MPHLLTAITDAWLSKLKLAAQHKWDEFGSDAYDAMRFYNGPHDFLYSNEYGKNSRGFNVIGDGQYPQPTFRMTVNKVSELVQLFLPVLYHRNPIRQVNPRRFDFPPELMGALLQLPAIQQQAQAGLFNLPHPALQLIDTVRAKLLEHYLNFTPHELDLREDSRKAVVEALIKGRGVAWTLLFDGPKGRLVGTFYDSVDNLLIDPDAEDLRFAQWVARRRREPVWRVEDKYKLPRGSLKPNQESLNQTADQALNPMERYDRATGQTNDQLEYYEVFSRMGIGGRLQGGQEQNQYSLSDQAKGSLETFGDNCYLVLAQGVEYPLNLPPDIAYDPAAANEVTARLAWPTPFHEDKINPWPFTELDFHTIPRKVWPMSHVKPAMGEQKFLDWAYSFIAGKIRTTCRDLIAYPKDYEEIAEALKSSGDLGLIPVEVQQGGTVKGMLEFIQHAAMNGDIWRVIEAVERNFEKRTGLTELMYGQTGHQYRSATEADVKQNMLNVRPDYMAERVENWATRIAAKEGLAARYHLDGSDVAPIFGEVFDPEMGIASGPYTQLWMQVVRQNDMAANAAELEYRIEAGSARKPNKDRDRANIDESAQVIFPALTQFYQQWGDPTPANAWLREWCRTREMAPDLIQLPDMREAMAQMQAQQMAMQQQQPQGAPA